jgi:phage FluMu protein Com
MEELRCPKCNRLLGKADLMPGSRLEIACRSKECKDTKIIQFVSKPKE